MKHYLYFSFLLICISINAQTNASTKVSEIDTFFSPKLTGETFIEKKGYKGEQFFYKDWAESDILLSTGEMVYGEKLKYNGLLDEVIWVNTSINQQFKLDKLYVSEFWLKNAPSAIIHFKRINVGEPTGVHRSDIFVEIGVEGKVSLYIQRKISIVGEENIYLNGTQYILESIGAKPLYYIKLPSNRYLMMSKIRRKALLKLFPEQKKAIIKLMRANHLDFKSEGDFIKVIDLLNKEVF